MHLSELVEENATILLPSLAQTTFGTSGRACFTRSAGGMAALALAPQARVCCPRLCRLRQAVQPQAFSAARRGAAKQRATCSAAGSAAMASSPASPQYSALVGKQVI